LYRLHILMRKSTKHCLLPSVFLVPGNKEIKSLPV
jgi:hypothetical protein